MIARTESASQNRTAPRTPGLRHHGCLQEQSGSSLNQAASCSRSLRPLAAPLTVGHRAKSRGCVSHLVGSIALRPFHFGIAPILRLLRGGVLVVGFVNPVSGI